MKTTVKQHRIALTVPKELDAELTELSLVLEMPKTAIITSMLLTAQPYLKQVTQVFKDVKEGQSQIAVESIQSLLGGMSTGINQAHMDFGAIRGQIKGIINAKSK